VRHIPCMNKRNPPDLEMTLEGEFVSPPHVPVATRLLAWAIVAAVVAGALFLAAFALWLAMLMLPVAIGATLIAWSIYRYRLWREQKAFGIGRAMPRS